MILLASSSETRAAILREAGVEFVQKGVDFEEELLFERYSSPKSLVYAVARGKLNRAVELFGNRPIIVADTVVAVGETVLTKASNEKEARKFLSLQSGSRVEILTATLFYSKRALFEDLSVTIYRFERFEEEEIERYIRSGRWRGKAGACMVEGFCKKYIKNVSGFESCARGLSIEKLLPFLKYADS